MKANVRYILAAALVPAVFVSVAYIVGTHSWLYDADPNYAYLLNCLRLLRFKSSGMWPHPGTTVQIIGELAIFAAWLATLGEHGLHSLYDTVIQAPEFYLKSIDALFVALDAAALVVLFQRLYGATRAYHVAIIGCATVLISAPAFLSLHKVTPEPLLLSSSLILAAILAPVAFGTDAVEQRSRYAVAVGCAIGFSLATKLTSAPLFLLVLWTADKSSRWRTLKAAAICALVLMLPIGAHFAYLPIWIFELSAHKGGYGSGAVGFPGVLTLVNNARILALASPETFLCPLLYAAVLGARRWGLRVPDAAARMLRLTILLAAVDILLVIKQPTARYLTSMVGPLCLCNAIVASVLLAARPVRVWMRVFAAAGFVAAGIALQTVSATAEIARRQVDRRFMAQADASGCFLIYYYEAQAVPYNLYFAIDWSGATFDRNMALAYPNFVAFRPNKDGVFAGYQGNLSRQAVQALAASKPCIALVGSPVPRFGTFGIDRKYLTVMAPARPGPADTLVMLRLNPDFFHDSQGAKP